VLEVQRCRTATLVAGGIAGTTRQDRRCASGADEKRHAAISKERRMTRFRIGTTLVCATATLMTWQTGQAQEGARRPDPRAETIRRLENELRDLRAQLHRVQAERGRVNQAGSPQGGGAGVAGRRGLAGGLANRPGFAGPGALQAPGWQWQNRFGPGAGRGFGGPEGRWLRGPGFQRAPGVANFRQQRFAQPRFGGMGFGPGAGWRQRQMRGWGPPAGDRMGGMRFRMERRGERPTPERPDGPANRRGGGRTPPAADRNDR
jgi:hypothetical protein